MANSMQDISSLTCIDGNCFDLEAAKALAETLEDKISLTFLDIRIAQTTYQLIEKSGLEEKGGVLIGKSLKSHKSLSQLDISENGIGDAGAIAIANSIRGNSALQELFIGLNYITNKGIKELADALKTHTGMHKLCVGYNNYDLDGLSELVKGLASYRSLRHFYIRIFFTDESCSRTKLRGRGSEYDIIYHREQQNVRESETMQVFEGITHHIRLQWNWKSGCYNTGKGDEKQLLSRKCLKLWKS
eukprot:TRINITY_DN113831_c0_g1_i1.p1 TRINITY_DN113831_c0_g1~~TRINITY_DN113831_c0_g1_i1.p1  ORF type:complete len:245 (-),score=3.04 TRINITY_DN113831_c0_g1_i1:131-865(-)